MQASVLDFNSRQGHFSYGFLNKRKCLSAPAGNEVLIVSYNETAFNHCVPIAHVGQFTIDGDDMIVDGPRVESDPPWAFLSIMENLTGIETIQNYVRNLNVRKPGLKDLLILICKPYANEWNSEGLPVGSSKDFTVKVEGNNLELFGEGCTAARVYSSWNGYRYTVNAMMSFKKPDAPGMGEILNHPFRCQIRYVGLAKK